MPESSIELFQARLSLGLPALSSEGYLVLDQAFSSELLEGFLIKVEELDTEKLPAAGVGKGEALQVASSIRHEQHLWLNFESPGLLEAMLFEYLEAIKRTLNRELFMGLRSYECQFAYYPKGGFYSRHRDQFRDDLSRKISLVWYLNPFWTETDGGQLCLYDLKGQTVQEVKPVLNRLILFASDMEHEVMPTLRDRYSLACWFKS